MIRFTAADPGRWGDDINLIITPASKAKTQILELIDGARYRVKKAAGFESGDVVVLENGDSREYNTVVKSQDNIIEFANAFAADCVDANLVPKITISTCEFNLEARYDDTDEFYGDGFLQSQQPQLSAQ